MYKKNLISSTFLCARHKRSLELLNGLAVRRVLDVGCDDGQFLSALSKKFPQAKMYGCDMDRNALAEARKTCPNVTFFEGNFLDLEFKSVDLIIMLEVLEHAPDVRSMLNKAAELIEENGHVLVSIPQPDVLHWNVLWAIWSNTLGRRWLDQHGDLTESQLIETASKAGLKLEKRTTFFFGSISIMLFRKTIK